MNQEEALPKKQSFLWQITVLATLVIFAPCAMMSTVHNLIDGQFVGFLTFGMFLLTLAIGFGVWQYIVVGGALLKLFKQGIRRKADAADGTPPRAWFLVVVSLLICTLTGGLVAWWTEGLTWPMPVLGYGGVGLLYGLLLQYTAENEIIDF